MKYVYMYIMHRNTFYIYRYPSDRLCLPRLTECTVMYACLLFPS